MRLITFDHQGKTNIGAEIINHQGKQFALSFNNVDTNLPKDMIHFLREGEPSMNKAKSILAEYRENDLIPMDQVKLRAPILNPGKIFCIGLTLRDHAEEHNQPIPEFPTVFAKFSNAIIGHGEPVILPKASTQVDYEVELAFIIGKKARNISEGEALNYVAGYTGFNDISARDFQFRTTQWIMGKTPDTFAPIGPAIVTSDEIQNPGNLEISLTLNGQEMQHSNTRNLIFTIPQLITYITQLITLEPGDMVATGTPAGVGAYRNPKVFLKPGDEMCVCIENIGKLINPIIAE